MRHFTEKHFTESAFFLQHDRLPIFETGEQSTLKAYTANNLLFLVNTKDGLGKYHDKSNFAPGSFHFGNKSHPGGNPLVAKCWG